MSFTTVTLFNIVHGLPGLDLVDPFWQLVSGDIFSCHLWVLVISFVMCNILNSSKSMVQKWLIKAREGAMKIVIQILRQRTVL